MMKMKRKYYNIKNYFTLSHERDITNLEPNKTYPSKILCFCLDEVFYAVKDLIPS